MKTGKVSASELAAERIQQAQERQSKNLGRNQAAQGNQSYPEEGKIELGLGRAIQQLANAEQFEAERAEKKNRILELVQKGEYNPRSEDVASSLASEIALEIATARIANEE